MPVYNHDYVVYMKELIKQKPRINICVICYRKWIEPFDAFYNIDLIPKFMPFKNMNI